VTNNNYILVIPDDSTITEIDRLLIGKTFSRKTIKIEEHLICQSKYDENRFQSVSGKIYQYLPSNSIFQCSYGSLKEIQTKIIQQDIFYTISGQSFQRFLIDNSLDERFYSEELYKLNTQNNLLVSAIGQKQPPYKTFNTCQEYFYYISDNLKKLFKSN